MRGGTAQAIEDGLGAKMSIGRHFRVRPLKRFEAAKAANQGGPAVNFIALALRKGDFFRLRGVEPQQPLSSSFCCFLPYLPCLASARLRHLRQKLIKNFLLRGASQFSAVCTFQDKENHEDNTLCIIKGFSAVLGNAGL